MDLQSRWKKMDFANLNNYSLLKSFLLSEQLCVGDSSVRGCPGGPSLWEGPRMLLLWLKLVAQSWAALSAAQGGDFLPFTTSLLSKDAVTENTCDGK